VQVLHGFYSKQFFYRHNATCFKAEASGSAVSIPLSVVTEEKADDDFTRHIIAKFQQDAVGKACQRTKLVTAVGRQLYSRRHRKPSKYRDIRKSCMRDKRRLGAMVLAFQSATSDDHKNVQP